MDLVEYFDKSVLQNVLRIGVITGITVTYAQHSAGIPVKQLLLTGSLFPQASSYEFFFCQGQLGLPGYQVSDTPSVLYAALRQFIAYKIQKTVDFLVFGTQIR